MIFIADVAGQYDALMRLVAQLPKDEPLLFLGDLVDRGPRSRECVEFAMKHQALMGNHEHMMLDYCRGTKLYDEEIWKLNGGDATIESYGGRAANVPEAHLDWIESLPLFWEDDVAFASHAPWHHNLDLVKVVCIARNDVINPNSLLWCRQMPKKREKFQVFGHNSHWGLKFFGTQEDSWAACLDDSRRGQVTALLVNGEKATLYQEPYNEQKAFS